MLLTNAASAWTSSPVHVLNNKKDRMRKKDIHKILLGGAVLATVLASSTLTGCQWFNGGSGDSTDSLAIDTIAWKTIEFEDSIAFHEAHAYQRMKISFPVITDSIEADAGTLSAIAWIRQQLLAKSYPSWEAEGQLKVSNLPTLGDKAEGAAAYVKACACQGLDSMAVGLRNSAEEGFGVTYENNLDILFSEQNGDFLTITSGHYVFMGGAHGGYISESATFSKQSGKRLEWSMFDLTKKAELQALLIKGVKSYFNEFAEEKIVTDEQLYENLILFDDPETPENEGTTLPLPSTPPALMKNQLSVVYQQYEIAAYACGLPSFTLTLEEIEPLLNAEGRAFFGLK